MSTTTDEYQYYVLKLPELSHSDVVCVPSSWIIERTSKDVIVKYPVEASSITNQRVENKEEYDYGWNIYGGRIIFGNDSYRNNLQFISRYKLIKNNSLQNAKGLQSSSTFASKNTSNDEEPISTQANIHKSVQHQTNFTKEAEITGCDNDNQKTPKKAVQDASKKVKKSSNVKCSTVFNDFSDRASNGGNTKENTVKDSLLDIPGRYTLLNQNIRVTKQKLLEITSSCTSNHPFNILCFTETGLEANASLILEDFKVISASNGSNSINGGAMIIVKNNISATERKDIVELSINNVCDISCAELEHHVVLCVYRYNYSSLIPHQDLFVERLIRALEIAPSTDKNIIVCGDFKVNTCKDKELFDKLSGLFSCKRNCDTYYRSCNLKCNILVGYPVQLVDLDPVQKNEWCRGALCINFNKYCHSKLKKKRRKRKKLFKYLGLRQVN